MEKKKLSPVAAGILNAVVSLVSLIAIYYVLSLVKGKPFAERMSEPLSIALLIVCPICAGVSSWNKAKNKGKEKKEL